MSRLWSSIIIIVILISDTAELFFDNVRVPAKNIVGKEGKGFIYQMLQFRVYERLIVLRENNQQMGLYSLIWVEMTLGHLLIWILFQITEILYYIIQRLFHFYLFVR